MIFLTWPNPEQLFVAQDVIKNKDYCGADIRVKKNGDGTYSVELQRSKENYIISGAIYNIEKDKMIALLFSWQKGAICFKRI